jgi:hypothetical protein
MIKIAAQHADNGHTDTARTVLSAAYRDGHLDQPGRAAGYLQYLAVAALTNLIEGKTQTTAIVSDLRTILASAQRLQERNREAVLYWCELVMNRLPHSVSIQKTLAAAMRAAFKRDYVAAFTRFRQAQAACNHNQDLVSRELGKRVADAGNSIMTHLLQNNTQSQSIAIVMELRAKGLVKE